MSDENAQPEDRSDEKLTPEKAWNLTEEQGYMGKVVADMYDVTPGYVSQLKGEYENAVEKGKSQVEPTDFDADRLENALSDKGGGQKFSKCPACKERIPTPDNPGKHDCPECGETLHWSESEI